MKINTMCFILLLFFLISAVSAADSDNETLQLTSQVDQSPETDHTEKLQLSSETSEVHSKTSENVKQMSVLQAVNAAATGKNKVSLKAPDVKLHYKDGSKFKVTLKDASTKKAIKSAKVKITINGATYTKTTNNKGAASINLNFNSGTYNVLTTYDGSKHYEKKSVKSTVTIKSTIKCSDFTKYYKNPSSYSSTFYDKKGKLLKNTAVKFKLNSKTYTVKTNKNGVGKLGVDLKPGKYSITSINSETAESITRFITIKTIVETGDLTINDNEEGKFSVKILNSYGKASPNKKVTLKVNGKTYTPKTDNNGIATITLKLDAGKYSIITEYEGLTYTNQITVNKVLKNTPFSHVTLIPNSVNVTTPYVFHNAAYALKTGVDGIIRMPKNELFTIQISETKGYLFSQTQIPGVDSVVIGYKTHLVPFDGSGVKSEYNRNKLTGNGILISTNTYYTQIEFRSNTEENSDLFGVYMDKGLDHSETITYIQNNHIKAKVNFYTYNYDELGLRNNLAKFYGKTIYDFNYKSYDEITNNEADKIKFANTNEAVTFNYFGRSIVGYPSKEDIITKLIVNGIEELEKTESISYGLSNKYRSSLSFEVLQSYAILNEKVTRNILQKWVDKNPSYITKYGIMNVYGMFLAALETAWLADEIADDYASEMGLSWNREKTTTILGGINLDDTYLHILNTDMGMSVSGDKNNTILFRLMNSINLPNIESYVLSPVADRFTDNAENSLSNMLTSINKTDFSFAQLGEMIYIFNGNDSAIAFNTTDGVSSVILSHDNNVYKGSSVATANDCCSVGMLPKDMVKNIQDVFKFISPTAYLLSDKFNNLYGASRTGYLILKPLLGAALQGVPQVMFRLVTIMSMVHCAGVTYRDTMVDKKDWYSTMDFATFTRPGYLQGKKIYNVPNKNGGTDYVEVKINKDLTLNRDNAIYISDGKTKKLTKEETYKYFTEEYWTPISMSTKYWDNSWKGS